MTNVRPLREHYGPNEDLAFQRDLNTWHYSAIEYLRAIIRDVGNSPHIPPVERRILKEALTDSDAHEPSEPRHTLDCDMVHRPNCTHCNCGSSIDPHYLEHVRQSPQGSVPAIGAPTAPAAPGASRDASSDWQIGPDTRDPGCKCVVSGSVVDCSTCPIHGLPSSSRT
jgi:hypothetical protein